MQVIFKVLSRELLEKVNMMILLQSLLTIQSSFNFRLVIWIKMK